MFKMKANSLPSILDSDCEDTEQDEVLNIEDSSINSRTSVQSCEKNYKNKKWKIPKFLRKQSTDVCSNDSEQQQPCCVLQSNSNINDSNNGYQQVPAIVESNYCHRTTYPENEISLQNDASWSSFVKPVPDNKENLNQDDNTKTDIIDIRSYISQSRSDIGQYDYSPSELSQFIRSGSYKSARSPIDVMKLDRSTRNDILRLDRTGSNRSHTGRTSHYEISPLSRARSATMAARVDMDCLDVPICIYGNVDNHICECASVNSRKDSGIRSNSRRSSIQQQVSYACIYQLN